MLLFIAVNDAEKTVFPNLEPPRHPKASPGQMTQRGRGKGEVWLTLFNTIQASLSGQLTNGSIWTFNT